MQYRCAVDDKARSHNKKHNYDMLRDLINNFPAFVAISKNGLSELAKSHLSKQIDKHDVLFDRNLTRAAVKNAFNSRLSIEEMAVFRKSCNYCIFIFTKNLSALTALLAKIQIPSVSDVNDLALHDVMIPEKTIIRANKAKTFKLLSIPCSKKASTEIEIHSGLLLTKDERISIAHKKALMALKLYASVNSVKIQLSMSFVGSGTPRAPRTQGQHITTSNACGPSVSSAASNICIPDQRSYAQTRPASPVARPRRLPLTAEDYAVPQKRERNPFTGIFNRTKDGIQRRDCYIIVNVQLVIRICRFRR